MCWILVLHRKKQVNTIEWNSILAQDFKIKQNSWVCDMPLGTLFLDWSHHLPLQPTLCLALAGMARGVAEIFPYALQEFLGQHVWQSLCRTLILYLLCGWAINQTIPGKVRLLTSVKMYKGHRSFETGLWICLGFLISIQIKPQDQNWITNKLMGGLKLEIVKRKKKRDCHPLSFLLCKIKFVKCFW